MAALSESEKHAIVTLLGQYARPAEVVVHMRHLFGIEIDRFQVRSYDPTNPRYEAAARWRPIFDAARQAYLSSIEAVPIAHKAYRLNVLQEGLDVARKANDWRLVLSLLRQAAKEVCGVPKNAHDPHTDVSWRPKAPDMTPEERRVAMIEVIREAMEQLRDKGQPQVV